MIPLSSKIIQLLTSFNFQSYSGPVYVIVLSVSRHSLLNSPTIVSKDEVLSLWYRTVK